MESHLFAIKNCYPRRFLAAVLEGIEPEITKACHLFPRGKHSKNTAGLLHPIGPGNGIVRPAWGDQIEILHCSLTILPEGMALQPAGNPPPMGRLQGRNLQIQGQP